MATAVRISYIVDGISQAASETQRLVNSAFKPPTDTRDWSLAFQKIATDFSTNMAHAMSALPKMFSTVLDSMMREASQKMATMAKPSSASAVQALSQNSGPSSWVMRQFNRNDYAKYLKATDGLSPDPMAPEQLSRALSLARAAGQAGINQLKSDDNDAELARIQKLIEDQQAEKVKLYEAVVSRAEKHAKEFSKLFDQMSKRLPNQSTAAMDKVGTELNLVKDSAATQDEQARRLEVLADQEEQKAKILADIGRQIAQDAKDYAKFLKAKEKADAAAAKAAEENARELAVQRGQTRMAWIDAISPTAARLLSNNDGPGGAAARIVKSLNVFGGNAITGALDAPIKFFEKVGNMAIRLSAIFYSFERLGNLVKDVGFGPIQKVLEATQKSREFQMSIAGVTGSMAQAQGIDNALISSLGNSPYTLAEARQSGQIAAKVSAMSGSFGFASPQEAGSQVASIADIVARLQIGNPDRTGEEIGKAIQLYLEGNARSVRTLGIDPHDIQAITGLSQKQLVGDQHAMLEALQTIVRQRVPDSIVNARTSQPEFLVEKLRDVLTVALQRVGDSGLYRDVGEKLQAVFSNIFKYVESSQFLSRAQELGQSMSKIFDGMGYSVLRLLQSLSGADSLAGTPDEVVKQIGLFASSMGDFARNLPGIVATVGNSLRDLGEHIAAIIPDAMKPGAPPLDQYSEERAKAQQRALSDLGLYGSSVTKIQVHDMEREEQLKKFTTDGSLPDDADTMTTGFGVKPGGTVTQQAIAEQILGIMSGVSTSTIKSPEALKYYLRQSFPDFESKIAGGNAGLTVPQMRANSEFLGSPKIGEYNSLGLSDVINGSPFGAKLMGAGRSIQSLRDLLPETADKSSEVSRKIAEQNTAVGADSLADRAKAYQEEQIKKYDELLAGLNQSLPHLTGKAEEMASGMIESLMSARAKMEEAPQAVQKILDSLDEANQRGAAAYFYALKGEDPRVRAAGFDAILRGDMSYQGGVGVLQGNALSEAEKSRLIAEGIQAKLDAMKSSGSPAGSSLIGGQGYLQQQFEFLSGPGMTMSQDRLRAATREYNNNPDSDEAWTAYVKAEAAVEKLKLDIRDLSVSSNEGLKSVMEFGNQVQNSMEKATSDWISGLIEGTANAKDIMKNFARSIIQEFSNISSHLIFNSIFGAPNGQVGAGNGIGGGLVGLLLGGLGGGGASGVGSAAAAGAVAGAANGAVWPGFSAFAGGSVVRRPTLGLVGERSDGVPELIAPLMGPNHTLPLGYDSSGVHAILPGNRKVAATFMGGPMHAYADGGVVGGYAGYGGRIANSHDTLHVSTIVVKNDEEANAVAGRMQALDANAVIRIVANNVRAGKEIHEAIRRGPGR